MTDPNFPVIEGVRVLNTITGQLSSEASIIIAVSMVLGICWASTTVVSWDDMSFNGRFFSVTVSIILIFGALLFAVLVPKQSVYQCLVDPSVSYQKLTETFTVIEQHGEIIDLMLK